MAQLAWIHRRVRSGWTRALRYGRSCIEKPPIKYLILTYRIWVSSKPFEGWDSRRVKYREYCAWAIALSLGATALDPGGSLKPNWLDGFLALTNEQRVQFASAFDMLNDPLFFVRSFKDFSEEGKLPGSTHLTDKMREKAGSVDPFDVANFLSTQDANLGRSYLAAIKRTERVNGISGKIISFILPLALLVGVFPMHRMLAPTGTPLKATERPYFLTVGFGILLTAALTVVVAIPLHYLSQRNVSGEGSGENLILAAAVCLAIFYMRKQSIYLNAVYDRSSARLFWAIMVSNCVPMFLGWIFAAVVLVVLDSVL